MRIVFRHYPQLRYIDLETGNWKLHHNSSQISVNLKHTTAWIWRRFHVISKQPELKGRPWAKIFFLNKLFSPCFSDSTSMFYGESANDFFCKIDIYWWKIFINASYLFVWKFLSKQTKRDIPVYGGSVNNWDIST